MVHISLALNKYSGNFGILHQAVEGMFNSLGPTTRAVGSPCWSSGLDAFYYDFGEHRTSDLEEMMQADTIVLWGINPVWTSIHEEGIVYPDERVYHLVRINLETMKAETVLSVKAGFPSIRALTGDGRILFSYAFEREQGLAITGK